jgi:hypothetical protein
MTRYLLLLLIPLGIAFIGLGIDDSSAAVYGYDRSLIFDLGVDSILVPDTIAGYLEIISRIKNYGTESIGSFAVEAKVWSIIDTFPVYDQTVLYPGGIYPGETLDIEFPGASLLAGTYLVQCSLQVIDENPSNDFKRKIVVVRDYFFDVGIDSCSLSDTIGPGEPILVWVRNYSSFVVDIPVSLKVYDIMDTLFPVFAQTLTAVAVPPNQRECVGFDSWYVGGDTEQRTYLFKFSTGPDDNPLNDTLSRVVVVRRHQGILEETNQEESLERIKATVMSVAQFQSQLLELKSKLKIYTATGQEVKPTGISRGIYFLKMGEKAYKILTVK